MKAKNSAPSNFSAVHGILTADVVQDASRKIKGEKLFSSCTLHTSSTDLTFIGGKNCATSTLLRTDLQQVGYSLFIVVSA